MKPIRNKLHVRPVEHLEKTLNGIIIPVTVKQEKIQCDVIAIGEQITITKVGDRVFIEPSTGIDIGDGTLIISEHEIRAIDPSVNKSPVEL